MSVLEALVAVAVLSIAIVPLLEIQAQIARTHQRYAELYERVSLRRSAYSLLREMNPMATPEATVELAPGVELAWSSTPLTSDIRSTVYPIGDGQFDVALFEVAVRIVSDRGWEDRLEIERLGWRQAAQNSTGGFVPPPASEPGEIGIP